MTANMPPPRSPMGMPARTGSSALLPVMDMPPPSPCTIWSKAGRL